MTKIQIYKIKGFVSEQKVTWQRDKASGAEQINDYSCLDIECEYNLECNLSNIRVFI